MINLPETLTKHIGLKIFPLVAGTKDPATRNGWKDASSDPAQIAEWHRINPNFNWGVACGPSKLFVFDIDPAGLDWWGEMVARDPAVKAAVERAFTVRTPKGGLHVYFVGEGPSTASRIAKGIDTRGGVERNGEIVSGGYVVLPGSATVAGPGRVTGSYEVVGGDLGPLPNFMAAIVPERKKTETHGLDKNPDIDKPRNVNWAKDLLNGYVQSGRVSVEGSGGNDTAYQVAASIIDKAISPATCYDLMWEIWNPHCSPPWEEFELERVIMNAFKYSEDGEKGSKGFQTNEDAFAKFVGTEIAEAKPTGDRARDKILALHDYADGVSDPEWLIPGLLPAIGTGMMYGDSGSYKSFLALDMALSLAHGIAGQWGCAPVKQDVLFLAGEGPVATAKKRWPAWMEHRNIEFRNDHRFFIKNRVPLYTDREAWEHVKEDLALLNVKPALIVIDTMSRLLTGLNENETKDATLITSFLEQLAHYFECFVLAIHHTGKDKSKGARGSSVFYANLDTVVSTRKNQNGTELRIHKQKDADVPDEIQYFEVKESASSIVLVKSDNVPAKEYKNGASRYDWASYEEVIKTLASLNGSASMATLTQTIAGRYGVARDLVAKQLKKNEQLRFLRPDENTWKIPKQEYDL